MTDTHPKIHVRTTEITVSALPETNINHRLYALKVTWRGGDAYAVKRSDDCVIDADGDWAYEPTPSSRDDAWIAAHRFSFGQAYHLAVDAAPDVTINGHTVTDALTAAENRQP